MLKTNLSSGEWRVAVDEMVSATIRDRQGLDDPAQPAQAELATAPSAERAAETESGGGERETDEATVLLPAALAGRQKGFDAVPDVAATPVDETPSAPSAAAIEEIPDPAAAVIGEVRGALLTEITEHPGIFLLTAETEIDRASLLGGLARELRAAGHFVSIVPGDGLTVRDLLFDLSLKAGIQPPAMDSLEPWLARFHAAARAAYIRRSLIVVLIDDAERLADDVMDQFAGLLFQAPGKSSSLRLLLTGHVPVERLADPQFLAARRTIVSQRHLRRLPNGTIAAENLPLAPLPAFGPGASARSRRTGRLLVGGASAAAVILAALWLLPEIFASGPAPAPTTAMQPAVAPLVIQLPSRAPETPLVIQQPSRTPEVPPIPAPPAQRVVADASPPLAEPDAKPAVAAAAGLQPASPPAEAAAAPPAEAAVSPPPVIERPADQATREKDQVTAAAQPQQPAATPDETPRQEAAVAEPAPPVADTSPAAETAPAPSAAPAANEASAMPTITDAGPAAETAAATVAADTKPASQTAAAPIVAEATQATAVAAASPPPGDTKAATEAAAPAEADQSSPVVVAAASPPPADANLAVKPAAPPAAISPAPSGNTPQPETKAVAAALTPPAPDAAAATPTPPTPAVEPKRDVAAARLPADAIAAMIRRGDEFLAIKDIAAARLFYERAAAAGNGRAATLAGKTYDPRYLQEIGARGLSPNPAKAAEWYRKAADLGDADAKTRLQGLPSR